MFILFRNTFGFTPQGFLKKTKPVSEQGVPGTETRKSTFKIQVRNFKVGC